MSATPLKLVHSAEPAPAAPHRPRLGEVLTAAGLLDPEALRRGLEAQRGLAARLGDLLCAEAALTPGDLLAALQRQYRAGTVDLQGEPPDPELIARLGLGYCIANRLLPWRRAGGATVIAVSQPDRFEALQGALEARLGPVRMVVVLEDDIRLCLARLIPQRLNARAESRVAAPMSCRMWSGNGFRFAAALAASALLCAAALWPGAFLAALTLLAVALLVAMTGLKLLAATAALRRPFRDAAGIAADPTVTTLTAARPQRLPCVSLLVPLYREEDIAGPLVRRLSALRYPAALLDICLITEADDTSTLRMLRRTPLPRTMRVVAVPPGTVRTKPRALNYALDFCRGEIVGVLDAEDAPEPDQVTRIVEAFEAAPPEVACLQGRLGFYNARRNPMARCFAIEYATWFSVFLPGIARLGVPVPLGGTTVYFRRAVLDAVGGWDAHNVTEDADLGIRLARAGYRTELVETMTLEEANCRLWPWIRQRSRWIKGYAMTYATHMRRPRQLWQDLGPGGFVGFQVLFLGTLIQAIAAPLLWLWWLIPLGLPHPLAGHMAPAAVWGTTFLLLSAEATNAAIGLIALRRTGQRRLWPFLPAMNLYHMLATAAAVKALAEMLHKPFFWDKTRHGAEPADHDTAAVAA